VWVVHSREELILDLVVLDETWPVTLEPSCIPWRKRNLEVLTRAGSSDDFGPSHTSGTAISLTSQRWPHFRFWTSLARSKAPLTARTLGA
jgi:hypothetical protein